MTDGPAHDRAARLGWQVLDGGADDELLMRTARSATWQLRRTPALDAFVELINRPGDPTPSD